MSIARSSVDRTLRYQDSTRDRPLVAWAIWAEPWFLLPAAVSGFLLQHAVQGWCPPIPVLRRLGFRTSFEIEQERQAMKLIRGDYKSVADGDVDAEDLLEAVQP